MMKLQLNKSLVFESFFEDATLFGIISTKKQYELCWLINLKLGTDFRVNNDIEAVLEKENRTCFFPIYEYSEPAGGITHYIYNNNFRGEFLVSDLKHIDYIWLMKGGFKSDEEWTNLLKEIRSLNDVQMVVSFKAAEIKNCYNLIF